MNIQSFFSHYKLKENPFSQEDAQFDTLLKANNAATIHHASWEKICGNPQDPATSVVFGEKGSGKTALRHQIEETYRAYNLKNPDRRVFVVTYDDFNPYLDTFKKKVGRGSSGKFLKEWKLWDHLDAILCQGMTRLGDLVLNGEASHATSGAVAPDALIQPAKVRALPRGLKRDLLWLATFYDGKRHRWDDLRKALGYRVRWSWRPWAGITAAVIGAAALLAWQLGWNFNLPFSWGWIIGGAALIALGMFSFNWTKNSLRARRISKQLRVVEHPASELSASLSSFPIEEIQGEPEPDNNRTDDRYKLLAKFKDVLAALDFKGIIILADRVDEPHLINGSPDRMKDFLWPLFDNKFLKYPGVGLKLLLPLEVSYFLDRENKEFYEKSRFDKQNMIRPLEWSGQSLYDLANHRMRLSAEDPATAPKFRDLFAEDIGDDELINTLARLRVPRHLFKFSHRLLVEHCNTYTEDKPVWQVGRETFKSALNHYVRDMEAYEKGMGTL